MRREQIWSPKAGAKPTEKPVRPGGGGGRRGRGEAAFHLNVTPPPNRLGDNAITRLPIPIQTQDLPYESLIN